MNILTQLLLASTLAKLSVFFYFYGAGVDGAAGAVDWIGTKRAGRDPINEWDNQSVAPLQSMNEWNSMDGGHFLSRIGGAGHTSQRPKNKRFSSAVSSCQPPNECWLHETYNLGLLNRGRT